MSRAFTTFRFVKEQTLRQHRNAGHKSDQESDPFVDWILGDFFTS
jgi:hypothetical protein